MEIELATPAGALVGLLAALPLAAVVAMGARARRVRSLLRLPEPPRPTALPALVAICLLAALLAAAAAQPVVAGAESARVRSGAQALFVIDTSRSMLARPDPASPTRIARARELAVRLRAAVDDVPVGLASLTDRLLPHAFATPDAQVFRATLARSMGVGKPPPRELQRLATLYEPLEQVVRGNLFPPGLARRVIVVFTDGEARETSGAYVRAQLRRAEPLTILFVRFWSPEERVFNVTGEEEPGYHPDATSGRALADFADAIGAQVFDEGEADAAAEALRSSVEGAPRTRAQARKRPRALAPYLAAAAFAPLLFLLWTRNRA